MTAVLQTLQPSRRSALDRRRSNGRDTQRANRDGDFQPAYGNGENSAILQAAIRRKQIDCVSWLLRTAGVAVSRHYASGTANFQKCQVGRPGQAENVLKT
jgi:hypothetical protein